MRDEDEEFDPWCPDIGMEHAWSEWEIGPYFPREERFCSQCGGMETQEIRPGPAPAHNDGLIGDDGDA